MSQRPNPLYIHFVEKNNSIKNSSEPHVVSTDDNEFTAEQLYRKWIQDIEGYEKKLKNEFAVR